MTVDRRPDPLAGASEAQAQPAADPHVAELRHQRLLARERLEERQLGTAPEPLHRDAVDSLAKKQHVFAERSKRVVVDDHGTPPSDETPTRDRTRKDQIPYIK